MKQIKFIIACFFFVALFSTCRKPGCLGKAGSVVAVTRSLNAFNELVLDDNINVVLTQGTEEKMVIEAPKNIEPDITSTISGNILTLMNTADCRWARDAGEKINVHLYFKSLKKIDYKGSGNITNTDTLKSDALQIESYTGAGNIELTVNNGYTGAYVFMESAGITLHGKTESCYTYTNARGQTDMKDFVAKKMVIEYGGLTDTYINVTDDLNVIIYYKGNIFYKGNPAISRATYYSSGKLIQVP